MTTVLLETKHRRRCLWLAACLAFGSLAVNTATAAPESQGDGIRPAKEATTTSRVCSTHRRSLVHIRNSLTTRDICWNSALGTK